MSGLIPVRAFGEKEKQPSKAADGLSGARPTQTDFAACGGKTSASSVEPLIPFNGDGLWIKLVVNSTGQEILTVHAAKRCRARAERFVGAVILVR
jgi:hypothetical protein